MRFPLGLLALIVISILVYFGLAQRVLDRLRLSDKGALGIIALMIVGSFINIPIMRGDITASINVGGALVPIGLCIYLLVKAGTTKEKVRSIIASIIVGVAVYFASRLLPNEPETMLIDPMYIYPVIGGLLAYLAGRSRRGAFIAGTLGIILMDIGHFIWLARRGLPGSVIVGGGGIFDSIVLSGLIAVLLAELIGETRERLQGGPESEGRPKELVDGLSNIEFANSLGVKEESKERGEEDA